MSTTLSSCPGGQCHYFSLRVFRWQVLQRTTCFKILSLYFLWLWLCGFQWISVTAWKLRTGVIFTWRRIQVCIWMHVDAIADPESSSSEWMMISGQRLYIGVQDFIVPDLHWPFHVKFMGLFRLETNHSTFTRRRPEGQHVDVVFWIAAWHRQG